MKKIVSLILALMLVFSMSAALAAQTEGTTGTNACTVKLMYTDDRDPFVTWTFPSEIIVNVSKDNMGSWSGTLDKEYFVEVSDLAIKSSQVLHFGFAGGMGLDDFGHAVFQNAPLSTVDFAMDGATRLQGNNAELNDAMEQGLKLHISLQQYISNHEYQSASSYVINENAVECGTATINFAVAFANNDLPF